MKIIKLLVITFIISISSIEYSSARDNDLPKWCKADAPTKINILPGTDNIKYDHSLNVMQLSSKHTDTDSPYDNSVVQHTLGLMSGSIGLSAKSEIGFIRKGKKQCLYFKEIQVNIHVSPTIYIANDYKRNGCMYKEIKEHELKHVKVDRKVINKYSNKVGHKILEIIDEMPVVGVIHKKDSEIAAERMRNYVKEKILYINNQMLDERKRRQNMVDSLEEYQRLEDDNLCPEEREEVAEQQKHRHRHR